MLIWRNPSTICSPVRTPQVPLEMSKRESAVRVAVRIFWIGADVFLDERRERGFPQVSVTVDSRIDKQIDVVGVSSRFVKTGFGGRDREVQGAVTNRQPPRAISSRSMIVPIALHQILVHGQKNHADLKT